MRRLLYPASNVDKDLRFDSLQPLSEHLRWLPVLLLQGKIRSEFVIVLCISLGTPIPFRSQFMALVEEMGRRLYEKAPQVCRQSDEYMDPRTAMQLMDVPRMLLIFRMHYCYDNESLEWKFIITIFRGGYTNYDIARCYKSAVDELKTELQSKRDCAYHMRKIIIAV